MSGQRLSKLQKTIIAVLSVMDKNDWESWYSKRNPNSKPPYWHRLRDEWDLGTYPASLIERGVKFNVQKVLESKKGIEGIFEALEKSKKDKDYMDKYFEKGKYFDTPLNEEVKSRFDMPYLHGASAYTVSFSRAVKTLASKKLIKVEFVENHNWRATRKQIRTIRLSVNN